MLNRFAWVALCCSALLSSCGGGGHNAQAPSGPDFSLSLTPQAASISPGNAATLSLTATTTGGLTGPISVQPGSLPTGVMVSPWPISLPPGIPQTVTVSADVTAPPASATVTLTGSFGSLIHSVSFAVTVANPTQATRLPFGMRYVRADMVTPDWKYLGNYWAVYHPPTSRLFVVDPDSSRLFVLDPNTQKVLGTIVVPGAFSVDDTPDHATLYVATQFGDIYTVDPVALAVTRRYASAEIGPEGFHTALATVLADGRLGLLGSSGGFNFNGFDQVAIWNPADNSSTIYGPDACGVNVFGDLIRTPDRERLLTGGLCQVDLATGTASQVPIQGEGLPLGFPSLTPDGNLLVFPEGEGRALVLDAHTFARVAAFDVQGDTAAARFFASADSKILYTPGPGFVFAYSLPTGQPLGWLPGVGVGAGDWEGGQRFLFLPGAEFPITTFQEGVGFLDLSALRTGPVGTHFGTALLDPPGGPVAGGTSTGWQFVPPPGVSSVYFGATRAASISQTLVSSDDRMAVSAITPPGTPGPVDVYALSGDGGIQYLPEAFTYGPTVVQVTPGAATTEGGIGLLYGYGLGPANSNDIPPDLRITVGGSPAAVTGYRANAYNLEEPPFPTQAVSYAIPPGVIGTADVTVTNTSGSVTVAGGIKYLPPVQKYPLPGASLAQGVYDPKRDVYYFTDATKVQVFSRTQGAWLTPMDLSASGAKRLRGLALSPDGSKLAIADVDGAAVYSLNPDTPGMVQQFAAPVYGVSPEAPVSVAISDSGVAYVLPWGGWIYKLDTTTGTVTNYTKLADGLKYQRLLLGSNGATVYVNNSWGDIDDKADVFTIDTSSDEIRDVRVSDVCYSDASGELGVAGDGSRFVAAGCIYDADLNSVANPVFNPRETLDVSRVDGAKMSVHGGLIYQPTNVGIDVQDGRLGTLLERISLPMPLSVVYDALVTDGKDSVVLAITGDNSDGIAVIDLGDIPEPAPLGYLDGSGATIKRAAQPAKAAPPASRSIPSTSGFSNRRGPKTVRPDRSHRSPGQSTSPRS